jgi:hypothetical protein
MAKITASDNIKNTLIKGILIEYTSQGTLKDFINKAITV